MQTDTTAKSELLAALDKLSDVLAALQTAVQDVKRAATK